MEDFGKMCFVCEAPIVSGNYSYNTMVNLPVCQQCKGTDNEKKMVDDLLEGLAERFVCGCI